MRSSACKNYQTWLRLYDQSYGILKTCLICQQNKIYSFKSEEIIFIQSVLGAFNSPSAALVLVDLLYINNFLVGYFWSLKYIILIKSLIAPFYYNIMLSRSQKFISFYLIFFFWYIKYKILYNYTLPSISRII